MAGIDVPHDAAVENVEAAEDKANSFAGTSEGSYPIMARALTSKTPKNIAQRENAGRKFW